VLLYSVLNIVLFPDSLLRVIAQPLLAVALAIAYVDVWRLRALSVVAGVVTILLVVLSSRALLSSQGLIDTLAFCATVVLLLLVLNLFHSRMYEALSATNEANIALRRAQTELESQVAQRTASLRGALSELETRAAEQDRLLAETEQQRATIRALGIPLLPVNQSTLTIPLVGSFSDERLHHLQEQALQAIEQTGARVLVIDITGVLTVDSAVSQAIVDVAQAARLMGARVVLAGVRPEMAETIVGLGLNLDNLRTVATLQEGIAAAAMLE
jgi:rsbT co-antagonist protein RsbR